LSKNKCFFEKRKVRAQFGTRYLQLRAQRGEQSQGGQEVGQSVFRPNLHRPLAKHLFQFEKPKTSGVYPNRRRKTPHSRLHDTSGNETRKMGQDDQRQDDQGQE